MKNPVTTQPRPRGRPVKPKPVQSAAVSIVHFKISNPKPRTIVNVAITPEEKAILVQSAQIEKMSVHALLRYTLRKVLRGDIVVQYNKEHKPQTLK